MLPSGSSTLNKDQIAERGARTTTPARLPRWGPRMARRDDREYRESLLSKLDRILG